MKNMIMIAAALIGVTAFADKVYLKSGSVLTGKVLGTKDGVVKFESDDFGVLDVKPVSVEIIKDQAEKPIPVTTISEIPKEPETWHGSIVGAYNASRGNTHEDNWSVLANLKRKWELDRVNFDLGYYYSETGKSGGDRQKTTDRWEIEGQHDHFWLAALYHYENIKWERDMITLLENRYRVGLGLGYQWLDGVVEEHTGKWSFNQEAGLNWVREEYEKQDTKEEGFAAVRYAHHLTFVPCGFEKTEFFHNLEVLPEVDDWDKYLAKTNLGLSTALVYDFTFNARVEWDYDSQPAAGRKKDDLRYILGLGYKW